MPAGRPAAAGCSCSGARRGPPRLWCYGGGVPGCSGRRAASARGGGRPAAAPGFGRGRPGASDLLRCSWMGERASLGLESVQPSKWTTGYPLCGLRTAARHAEELRTRRSWVEGGTGDGGDWKRRGFCAFCMYLWCPSAHRNNFCATPRCPRSSHHKKNIWLNLLAHEPLYCATGKAILAGPLLPHC